MGEDNRVLTLECEFIVTFTTHPYLLSRQKAAKNPSLGKKKNPILGEQEGQAVVNAEI